jgi:hypothetical protein
MKGSWEHAQEEAEGGGRSELVAGTGIDDNDQPPLKNWQFAKLQNASGLNGFVWHGLSNGDECT